jgi:hypothetical protein
MISVLAHLTPVEAPAGILLFLAGCAVGLVVAALLRRLSPRR